mmetsp:Transcript_35253/g.67393  ORF Transcript_35253/g.67393 Transcript_35253/m.67393 type:complete len:213 (-) Transcript_35253:216-854(-)|eukprot:CAMPEP_0114249370 /NCGR_PEP_ID=MMETSP0058-20121206/14105_1 /TAXON_ID=36894 /ORGANISM="Pyramimonas parkeae, CCMP726" /LENGTH=212 /DNA_ID=CAMNT_0001362909 /DNA_START=442 /DNA_END=1080 /DNA_ORIENTATION=-
MMHLTVIARQRYNTQPSTLLAAGRGTRLKSFFPTRTRAVSEDHGPSSEKKQPHDAQGYREKRPGWRKKYLRFLPFEEARKCAQHLCFDSREQWDEWVDEGKKSPYLGPYMPSDPEAMYAGEGWTDWEDFLGVPFPFETAREHARGLGLSSIQEWWSHVDSGALPARVPSRPDWVYRNDGWETYEDWLGCDPPKEVQRSSHAEPQEDDRSQQG